MKIRQILEIASKNLEEPYEHVTLAVFVKVVRILEAASIRAGSFWSLNFQKMSSKSDLLLILTDLRRIPCTDNLLMFLFFCKLFCSFRKYRKFLNFSHTRERATVSERGRFVIVLNYEIFVSIAFYVIAEI